jgi:hypothetical protein
VAVWGAQSTLAGAVENRGSGGWGGEKGDKTDMNTRGTRSRRRL